MHAVCRRGPGSRASRMRQAAWRKGGGGSSLGGWAALSWRWAAMRPANASQRASMAMSCSARWIAQARRRVESGQLLGDGERGGEYLDPFGTGQRTSPCACNSCTQPVTSASGGAARPKASPTSPARATTSLRHCTVQHQPGSRGEVVHPVITGLVHDETIVHDVDLRPFGAHGPNPGHCRQRTNFWTV